MMRNHSSKTGGGLFAVSSAALIILASLGATRAHAAPGDSVATITHLSGVVSTQRGDGSPRLLSVQSSVMDGDMLTTGADAFVRLRFVDQSELVIRPASVFRIAEFTYRQNDPKLDRIRFELVTGGFRAVSGLVGKRSRDAVSFATPTATVGIRGTHFGALFCQNDCGGVPTPTGSTPQNGLHVDVAQGAIVVTGPLASSTVLNAGQFGFLPPPSGGVQPPLVLVPPSTAVQVRMPTSISQNVPTTGVTGKAADLECVVQ
jgi:FecR protein